MPTTTQSTESQAKATNFSLAFQQMASFVAIAKTRSPSEIRDALILECFLLAPAKAFSQASDFADTISASLGIEIPVRQLEGSLRSLLKKETLGTLPGGHLTPNPTTHQQLQDRLSQAKELEHRVQTSWFQQVASQFPILDQARAWDALKHYLSQIFRRHGIQAVALLDPTMDLGPEYSQSLSSLLNDTVRTHFEPHDWDAAKGALATFCATTSLDRQRAKYIALLADGAFNYFSLTVPPEVSNELRKKLSPLTLFLDTNFILGILDLNANPQVDVSAELLESVKRFNLPFKLSYHEATVRETQHTLYYFQSQLSRTKWSQAISRAASSSGVLTGIELRYHQRNAQQCLEVEDFFAPLRHWQVLLKDKGINLYKVMSTQEELKQRATLEAEYRDFLSKQCKYKPDEAIQHDMAVLHTVRRLRTHAKNTLEAGALLVTCDYSLYRFDWESSRQDGRNISIVLPNLLWQVLRPYVTTTSDFDKAFAETFALPELGALGGGAAAAASRMLSILAGYKDLPEQTAAKMLSNDLLLADLESAATDQQFQALIDSAIVATNAVLTEEKAALATQLEQQKAQNVEAERRFSEATDTIRLQGEKLNASESSFQALQTEAESQRKAAEEQRGEAEGTTEALKSEQAARQAAIEEAKTLLREKKSAERRAEALSAASSIIIGALLVLLLELTVNSVIKWTWLQKHPNSYGIQACVSAILFFGVIGAGAKHWRKYCWGVAGLALLCVLLQILGGPSLKP